jgi:CRP-like cAMP-binding protein
MNLFRSATDAKTVPAGTELCRQGEPGDTMFAIVEGTVEIHAGGRLLETFGAGDFFGEMSLIDKSPRSATARATTDCRIVVIDEKRFNFMVQQTPFFALEVMRVITARLRHRLQELS